MASRLFFLTVLLLARIVLVRLVGRLVCLVSFPPSRLCLLARCVLFICVYPWGVSFYPRSAVPPSRHIVLPWRLVAFVSFSFHSSFVSVVLWICDKAFLRGRRAIRIITMGVRLVPYGSVGLLLARSDGVGGIRYPARVIRS